MQPHTNTYHETSAARFALGQTVITPGAQEALEVAGQTAIEFLRRHVSGDWGELSDGDIQENELSVEQGFRLLSRYETAKGERFWIITEADRSATTILLPLEY
jgi:glycine cleavage system aminomethyltransferase T